MTRTATGVGDPNGPEGTHTFNGANQATDVPTPRPTMPTATSPLGRLPDPGHNGISQAASTIAAGQSPWP